MSVIKLTLQYSGSIIGKYCTKIPVFFASVSIPIRNNPIARKKKNTFPTLSSPFIVNA